MTEKRGNLYLLTGLILGLAVGLVYAWVINPLEYEDTEPISLAADDKAAYRQVIALAYQANPNLNRASERLKALDGLDNMQGIIAQAQQFISENETSREARALTVLAAALSRPQASGETPAAQPDGTQTPEAAALTEQVPGQAAAAAAVATADAVSTAAAAATAGIAAPAQASSTPAGAFPTLNPTADDPPPTEAGTSAPRPSAPPDGTFQLVDRQQICDGNIPEGLLLIQVNDADEQPLPGVRIRITWQDGEDVFYTGLASDINAGYADFRMMPETVYNLRVGETSQPVNNLVFNAGCGLRLEFAQDEN